MSGEELLKRVRLWLINKPDVQRWAHAHFRGSDEPDCLMSGDSIQKSYPDLISDKLQKDAKKSCAIPVDISGFEDKCLRLSYQNAPYDYADLILAHINPLYLIQLWWNQKKEYRIDIINKPRKSFFGWR